MKPAVFSRRPSLHLEVLMKVHGFESAYSLGEYVWPGLPTHTSRGRIRNWLDGRNPSVSTLVDVAAYFEVDPGLFYQRVGPSR